MVLGAMMDKADHPASASTTEVSYIDSGSDAALEDRAAGTVRELEWRHGGWTARLLYALKARLAVSGGRGLD